MALKQYGVLIGTPVDTRPGTSENPHFQVKVVDHSDEYRIAINVKSQIRPFEVLYFVNDRFSHPILDVLTRMDRGWHLLANRPDDAALDYIRGNLFDPQDMRPLPADVPGEENDLNEKVGHFIERACRDEHAVIYAFGQRFGPEPQRDKIFGFKPGNGVHDIHMNQGNDRSHQGDDGVFQDGGLIIHFPNEQQFVAIFLAFQSQVWHTDDRTGHALPGFRPGLPGTVAPTPPRSPEVDNGQPAGPVPAENAIRVVAAVVNPIGADGVDAPETVTLLNTTPKPISLDGWALADKAKNLFDLTRFGTIPPGETVRIPLDTTITLGNKGGIITVLNRGIKVHGVSYTKEQASVEGATVFFS